MGKEFIISTGRIIKEYLDEYKINQKDLSVKTETNEEYISNLLNGNDKLTKEFAFKLEKVLFGIPASYWLNYETKYQEMLADEEV